MADRINRIRNADFSRGKSEPKAWGWSVSKGNAEWRRPDDGGPGMVIAARARASAGFSQELAVKPGNWYRVEADVECRLHSEAEGGLTLSVDQFDADGEAQGGLRTPAILKTSASGALTVRTLYEVTAGIKRLRIGVGIESASGEATVRAVRLVKILEPDLIAHALSLPAPPLATEPVPKVTRVGVCSSSSVDRPLLEVLNGWFGADRVKSIAPGGFAKSGKDLDAVIFPDHKLVPDLKSMRGLYKMAADKVIVISLSAFASLASDDVSVKVIEQEDDPIHAKVMYACFATHGFALQDIVPFAWQGKLPGTYIQRQFRKTKAFEAFRTKNHFEVLLESMCDKDQTSEKPIALYRTTAKGAIFVVDTDPVESPMTSFGETNLAVRLLLAMLGQLQSGVGQYCVPAESAGRFRGIVREMAVRFNPVHVHDADVPDDEVTDQLVTIGGEDQTFGLPIKPKSAIIIRTGLTRGDLGSVYGGLCWIKQLIRMVPFASPYAEALCSKYRIAWVPSVAPWEGPIGFAGTGAGTEAAMEFDTQDGTIAAVIDVVSRPVQAARVVVPSDSDRYRPYLRHLPQLALAFPAVRGMVYAPEPGATFADRTTYGWRVGGVPIDVAVDAEAFDKPEFEAVRRAGGSLIRIEVPGNNADFVSHSVERTEMVVHLLEWVVGLQFGLIAVNRGDRPVQFGGFAPIEPGGALLVDDPALLDKAKAS